jgi:hypothetical protein
MLPAPTPHRAGGAAGRSKDIALHPTPRLHASPSSGVDGMSRQAGAMLARPSPHLPASPFIGVVGRLCSNSLSCYLPNPRSPVRPPLGPALSETGQAPAVLLLHRERNSFACTSSVSPAGSEPASKYGYQEILLSCRLQAATIAIAAPRARRHCRRRRRRPVSTRTDEVCTLAPSSAAPRVHMPTRAKSPTSPPKTAGPEHPMHEPTQPDHSPGSSPNSSPPPAKRTRKAARKRCEAELLRDGGEEGDLLLSPLMRPSPALTPGPPTPPPAPTPTPQSALPVLTSSQGPPTPACSSPEQPSPTAAPVIPSTPPTPCVSPPPPPPATGLPTPPPWPEAYIFSTDPDRIVCRKYCKRHYNFHWYSHCFMCN